jgi:hypothetical protein
MKTLLNTVPASIYKETRTYRYDKLPSVLLVESEYSDKTVRSIQPSRPVKKHVFLKDLTLWRAKYAKPCELPYTIEGGYDSWSDDDATQWASELAVSHSGQDGFLEVHDYQQFEADVLSIDFRVFDEVLANSLQRKYAKKSKQKTSTVDADLLLQGELGELPEQREK